MPKNRIPAVDAISGLASYGILAVNIRFSGESYRPIGQRWRVWPGFWPAFRVAK